MHLTRFGLIGLGLAAVALLGHQASFSAEPTQEPTPTINRQKVQAILGTWGQESRKAAEAMLEKYGMPAEATDSKIVWHGNGPWVRTIVYKEEIPHYFPKPHVDVLEQVVSFRVPPEKFSDLAHYDGSVVCQRTNGEMSARCDQEAMNFLALNLSHDIIEGEKDFAEARQFYADVAARFMAGDKHAYTQGLQFEPMRPRAARDADTGVEPSTRAREAGAPKDEDR